MHTHSETLQNAYPTREDVLDVKHVTLGGIIRLIQLFMKPAKGINRNYIKHLFLDKTRNMLTYDNEKKAD